MPIKNPFARRSGVSALNNDSLHPSIDAKNPGFERVDTVGSKASSAQSIHSNKSQDNEEYEMSVVNDSGVYLPPSPTEEKGQWHRKLLSRNSSETHSSFGEIDPFTISRESFDSYRRSFDISARSPISHDAQTRQSLDSARFPRPTRSVLESKMNRHSTLEESFEEVGLDDQRQQLQQQLQQQQQQQQQQEAKLQTGPPRKRGFFSKLTDNQEKDAHAQPNQPMSRFLNVGRKRGQSGQGSELGSIDQFKAVVTAEAN